MNRREFVAMAAAAGAGGGLRGGVIGSGNRGRWLMPEFREMGVELVAVSDVYEPNLQAGLAAASPGARPYPDYRRLLEDKSIDVVLVATPDHWHARMAIDAVEAGKDVYVEKPMAHTIEDGFRLVEAARRTRRVVQVGTQRRSHAIFREAKAVMDSGALGTVRLVQSWWLNKTGESLRPGELKGKLDWEQWLGPAPRREFDPVRFFRWYWFLDYSGGMLAGQGAHIIDAINWFMNSRFPLAATCAGHLALKGAEVPETATVLLEYPEYMAVFTLGYKSMQYPEPLDQLKRFQGAQARLDVGREAFALYREDPKSLEPKPAVEKRDPGRWGWAERSHIRNFLECVRSRRDPNATVEDGLAASVALAMALESLRTGRRVRFNPEARRMET